MANTVLNFIVLISTISLKGVDGACVGSFCLNSLGLGTIIGIAIGSIVALGFLIALIVACCIHCASSGGGRATRGTVIQPTNQPTVISTSSTSQAYPMHGYAQPPPPYMHPQPANALAPVNTNPAYPPNAVPPNAGPPNAGPPNGVPPPVYNMPTAPK